MALQFCPQRLKIAKRAFTLRRVPFDSFYEGGRGLWLCAGPIRPRAGDVVLARVDRLGLHGRLELPDGRKARLHVGDEILVAYGDRYAPDQFEARIPMDLGPTNLVASGGLASTVVARCGSVSRATDVIPIALVADDARVPLNLSRFGLRVPEVARSRPPTIAVVGTSMNSGKTTAVQGLVLGLRASGETVGATKVTGTGSGADYWTMVDAGAACVVDFTDVGVASTYRIPFGVTEANFAALVDHLTNAGCSAIVIEVADGIHQPETARLLASDVFRACVDRLVFAAADAVGVVAGTEHLRGLGLRVVGASGLLTRSPLAHREASGACAVPVYAREELRDPAVASRLLTGQIEDWPRPATGNGATPAAVPGGTGSA